MLTTSEDAGNRVCLADMVSREDLFRAGRCLGQECSAWHWEAATGAPSAERLGYCGIVGCVERRVRKHPRRMVETTVVPS